MVQGSFRLCDTRRGEPNEGGKFHHSKKVFCVGSPGCCGDPSDPSTASSAELPKLVPTKNSLIDPTQWLAINYHKTGYQFSRCLFATLALLLKLPLALDQSAGKLNSAASYTHAYSNTPIGVQSLLQLSPAVGWQHTLLPSGRIVHFVRDVKETIISAMLYHKQDPPPEVWLNYPRNILCLIDREQVVPRALAVGIHTPEVTITSLENACKQRLRTAANGTHEWFRPGYEECHQYKNCTEYGYGAELRRLYRVDPISALVVEAIKTVPSMFLMVVNSLASRNDPHTKQVEMKDWSAGGKSGFLNTTAKLLDFLSVGRGRWAGITVAQGADAAAESCYVPHRREMQAESIQRTSTSHHTWGLVSSSTRAEWMRFLTNDLSLGPVLNHLNSVLFASRIQVQDSSRNMLAEFQHAE